MMKIYCCLTSGTREHREAGRKLLGYALSEEGIKEMPSIAAAENGKPYFPYLPEYRFNISHSGEYALCVLSDEEVGADIQENKKIRKEVRERFLWDCPEEEAARVWSMREAYGKFTGEGALADYMKKKCRIKEYPAPEGYFIFVCCESGNFADGITFAEV